MLRTGTTVVTVTFKNIKTAKSTAKKYRCVVKAAIEQKPEEPATTAGKITAIKQTSATKLAAEFSADMTGIKYTDLKIVRDETGAVVTVKSATVDKTDATKVTIETYEALTDGKAYTVTYTAADEAKTESSANFTATAGVVADIALNTYSIPANTPTVIKYQLLDANGVLIEEKGIGGKSKSDKIDISIENFNGYQNENEVTLYKTGDKATMKVVYHTWKYNNTDGTEEGKVERSFEITAVDQSSVIETYEYSVAGEFDVVDFKRDTLKTQLAIDDDKDSNPHAKFSFRKADGTDITKNLDYTVESGNENVLLASGSVAGNGAKLTPVAVGATYLVIKNAAGSVVKTLPITVVAKRELSTMSVDNSHVTISEGEDGTGTQKVTISVMDQYSDAYTKFTAGTAELKSGSSATAPTIAAPAYNDPKHTKVTFAVNANSNTKAGTYTYTVDLTDTEKTTNVKKVTFSVTVSKELAVTNDSFALVMMRGADVTSKVDTTVGVDNYSTITLNPVIVVKNNGVITKKATVGATGQIVSIGGLTLTKNGATVDNTNNIYTGTGNSYDLSIADPQVKVAAGSGASGDPIVKYLDAGTYTLSFKAYLGTVNGNAKYQNMSTSFVVEDSQKAFEASVKVEKIENGYTTLQQVFEDTDFVKFSYAGHELSNTTNGIDKYFYQDSKFTNVNDKSTRVEKVTMDVQLPGTSENGTSNKLVRMTTPVNRTFTFNSGVVTTADTKKALTSFKNTYKTAITTTGVAVNAVADALAIQAKYSTLGAADKVNVQTDYNIAIATGSAAAMVVLNNTESISDANMKNAFVLLGFNGDNFDANKAVYRELLDSNTNALSKTDIENMIAHVATAQTDANDNATAVATKIATVPVGTATELLATASGSVVSITSESAVIVSASAFTVTVSCDANNKLTVSTNNSNGADQDQFTVTYSAITAKKTVTVGSKTKDYTASATLSTPIVVTYKSDGSAWSITNP